MRRSPVSELRIPFFRFPAPCAKSETTRSRRQTKIRNPQSEIQSAPKGELVLDPTVSVDATQDVWLESVLNKNDNAAGLIVGKMPNELKKRTLIQFDLSALPAGANIVKAQLKLKYDNADKGSRS